MRPTSGPITTFASHISSTESKCRYQKDHWQLYESSGIFEFDI